MKAIKYLITCSLFNNLLFAGGVVDGGGGEIGTTPISKVTEQIISTWKKALSEDLHINLVGRLENLYETYFFSEKEAIKAFTAVAKIKYEDPSKAIEVFQEYYPAKKNNDDDYILEFEFYNKLKNLKRNTKLKEQLKRTKLTINTKDYCKDFKGNDVDGSVTAFELKADVCVSSFALSRFPIYSIEQVVTIIILHEISHLVGNDEDHAYAMQSFVANNMNRLLKSESKAPHMTMHSKFVNDAQYLNTVAFYLEQGNLYKAGEAMGTLVGIMKSMLNLLGSSVYNIVPENPTEEVAKTWLKLSNTINSYEVLGEKISKGMTIDSYQVECKKEFKAHEELMGEIAWLVSKRKGAVESLKNIGEKMNICKPRDYNSFEISPKIFDF